MDIRITIIDPETDGRWDDFVEQHAYGWICHLSGWKHVLENSFKHMRGYYLALMQGQTIRAALPIYEVRSRIMGNRLVSVPFATISDPLVSSGKDVALLLDAAKEIFERIDANFMEIRAFSSSAYMQEDRLEKVENYKHHYIVLDRPIDDISKTFHRSCVRQRIARSLKSGITFESGETELDLKQFYNLYLTNRKRLSLPPQPYLFIKSLWDTFHPSKKITLLMARKDGALIGCLMFFRFKDRVSAEFAAYDDSYLNISPLHGMFWEAIQAAQREGYRIFDFGRTSLDNSTLIDFKDRWGTEVTGLPQFYFLPDHSTKKVKVKNGALGRQVFGRMCKFAPKPLYIWMGNILYKHMG
ncbi:MAG: GNAT family N-acetyltransferase [Actinomycetota bacterium]|nr:GNAT family N-acetyltransferase [Nitrospiraceae bacterium]MDA8155548.1 GNAT family N-acetyltransferase [Actinomycetota bacterium]